MDGWIDRWMDGWIWMDMDGYGWIWVETLIMEAMAKM
jgi:hypothetical protein